MFLQFCCMKYYCRKLLLALSMIFLQNKYHSLDIFDDIHEGYLYKYTYRAIRLTNTTDLLTPAHSKALLNLFVDFYIIRFLIDLFFLSLSVFYLYPCLVILRNDTICVSETCSQTINFRSYIYYYYLPFIYISIREIIISR